MKPPFLKHYIQTIFPNGKVYYFYKDADPKNSGLYFTKVYIDR